MDSADEALCEMLGLSSLGEIVTDADVDEHDTGQSETQVPCLSQSCIDYIGRTHALQQIFQTDYVCMFPTDLSVPMKFIKRITNELVWAGSKFSSDRTYETIKVWKAGLIEERRVLTRLENFVNSHDEWKELCQGYLRRCISSAMGTEMVLYKEKLNLKPPGGSGFAPHLDSPSLRIALGKAGPQTFVTVMVSIDAMNIQNGCLRICKEQYSEDNHCPLVLPEQDGNPDAGGRAGAIPPNVAESMKFDDVICQSGDIVVFNGYVPHRSSGNLSPFPRRAVFLTYNPKSEGDFHDRYYERMEALRSSWRTEVGGAQPYMSADEKLELESLATIPK